ncbi:MAG: orotate phosphoribosyltransferase [Kiritimatiellae bacterium]|nr:orotate phosphoribosyltransferase [Kiritimatiellia bacterium]
MSDADVLAILRETGAVLSGHFELRSGLHSDQYVQCALVLQWPAHAARLCGELARRVRAAGWTADAVIAPAMGGLFVGHELARALGVRSIFAEKQEGRLVLRRGFRIRPGERFLVAEDVVTRGGRVQETLDIVREGGGIAVGVTVLVDRSGGAAQFSVPLISLLRITPSTWAPASCPLCAAGSRAEHPGS